MMRHLPTLIAVLSLFAVACANEVEEPPPASTSSAMVPGPGGGGDCSTTLGNCYIACQNVSPTPTQQCFQTCTNDFNACIR